MKRLLYLLIFAPSLSFASAIFNPGSGDSFNGALGLKIGDFDYGFGYTVNDTGAGYAKDFGPFSLNIKHPDGTYARMEGMLSPYSVIVSSSFASNNTSADENGNVISLPYGVRVRGAAVWWDSDANADIVAYNSSGVAIATATTDTDIGGGANGSFDYFIFNTTFTVSANTQFRLTVKPTTTTNVTLYGYTAASATQLDTAFPLGSRMIRTSRVDNGTFSDTSSQRFIVYPVIDQINVGAASASSFIGP